MSKKYKGHSDFVKAIICARIGGKDVSATILEVGSLLMFAVPHIWRSRLEDHGVGYNVWRTLAHPTRQIGYHDGGTGFGN